jgi:hypothetical protein
MSVVYVDDFLLAAVENTSGMLLQRMARATLHAIHSIFPALAAMGIPGAKDPVSKKKLAKGDACWDSTKEILGYWLDGGSITNSPVAPGSCQLSPTRSQEDPQEVEGATQTVPINSR